MGRSASAYVYVQSPLEQSWKDTYPSDYFIQANDVVEAIDDYLYEKFGIDFYSLAQPSWYLSATDPESAIYHAINNVGLGDADMMLAFAGALYDTSTKTNFGISTISNPYALVFAHGYHQNIKTGQHEIGHTYGLEHCFSGACVMCQGPENGTGTSSNPYTLFNKLCTTHYNAWYANKDQY